MSCILTRSAYQQLVDEDVAWLEKQPRTLEREHVIVIVKQSVDALYGRCDELRRSDESAAVIPVRSLVRIANGGGRGVVTRGPAYCVRSDQGGEQWEDAEHLSVLSQTKTSETSRSVEEDTNMRAAGEKPDLVGRASGMAGSCPDANPSLVTEAPPRLDGPTEGVVAAGGRVPARGDGHVARACLDGPRVAGSTPAASFGSRERGVSSADVAYVQAPPADVIDVEEAQRGRGAIFCTIAEADRIWIAHKTCIERGQLGTLIGIVSEIKTHVRTETLDECARVAREMLDLEGRGWDQAEWDRLIASALLKKEEP